MDKDINRIEVVLAEKGGSARLSSVLWRAPENQQMTGKTTGLCSNNSVKVVYQRLSANYGYLSKDSRTTGCGTDRTGESKETSNKTTLYLSLWVTIIHLFGNSEKLVGK